MRFAGTEGSLLLSVRGESLIFGRLVIPVRWSSWS